MPFKKQGPDDYTGPTGKHFNGRQVRYYYANGGHFAQGGDVSYVKGMKPQEAAYAQGGSVLGRVKEFSKESDGHQQRYGGMDTYVNPDLKDSTYTKKKPTDHVGPDNSKSSTKQHVPRGKK